MGEVDARRRALPVTPLVAAPQLPIPPRRYTHSGRGPALPVIRQSLVVNFGQLTAARFQVPDVL